MGNIFRRRPTASMIVAVAALMLAASGTAVAAGLVSGDSLIKKRSLSGNRLRNHTITGQQINLGKLGKVPSASNADHSTTADSATSATNAMNATNATNAENATNATSASEIGKLYYRSAPLAVPGTSDYDRATGTVSCPAGTFAVGGGAASADEGLPGPTDYLIDSYPTANRTGWTVTMENESAAELTETVWAVCIAASTTG